MNRIWFTSLIIISLPYWEQQKCSIICPYSHIVKAIVSKLNSVTMHKSFFLFDTSESVKVPNNLLLAHGYRLLIRTASTVPYSVPAFS